MSDLFWELREKYRAQAPKTVRIVVPEPTIVTPEPIHTEKAFVIETNGKAYVTGLANVETAKVGVMTGNKAMMQIKGRYVGAEKANSNNAFWSTGDLEFGQASVVGGPVNLLHQDNQIVGCITKADLVREDVNFGPHLVTESTVWSFLYPNIAANLERESANKNLYYSMECIAETVMCVDGCGESFDYAAFSRDRASACSHLANGGVRRLVNPTFLGVGLIFGKTEPGWASANAEVVREASQLAEDNDLVHGILSKSEAENLVMSVLKWASERS